MQPVTVATEAQLYWLSCVERQQVSADNDILAGESGSALIDARNERALQVLAREMTGRARRIGIFYGAAHLPGMAQRLRDEFGFAPRETVWIDAWQLGD
ncbi:MAG: hypothetical protein HKN19_12950 [Halioglobus sp.]|nr:hypothetical protein [Halioglobus sp.]